MQTILKFELLKTTYANMKIIMHISISNLKFVSSQCAPGKSSIARKLEVHPKIFKW